VPELEGLIVDSGVVGALIPIVSIIGGLSVGAYSMTLRMKARKLIHEERLAMIEKGLVPPPLSAADLTDFPKRRRSSRHVGVILVAVGVGMGVLIALNDEPRHALGVGGLVVMIGLAFLLNSILDQRQASTAKGATSDTDIQPPR
jgi:hypothetical protein